MTHVPGPGAPFSGGLHVWPVAQHAARLEYAVAAASHVVVDWHAGTWHVPSMHTSKGLPQHAAASVRAFADASQAAPVAAEHDSGRWHLPPLHTRLSPQHVVLVAFGVGDSGLQVSPSVPMQK